MCSYRNYIDKLSKSVRFLNTPLQKNKRLSEQFNSNIYIKREDLQQVRSFKIRGAYNKIQSLSYKDKYKGVVCASAGNHAQGFAYTCNKLKINGDIFLPENTPLQKIEKINYFSNKSCKLHIKGNNFEKCLENSIKFTNKYNKVMIHPYDDCDIINGNATIASEIYNEIGTPDIIICTIGGGGLISGIGKYFNNSCKIIGVEPSSCTSMYNSVKNNKIVFTEPLDNFVDGATVPKIGDITFQLTKKYVSQILNSSNGQVCKEILNLYQHDGIISEPAGVLPFTVLDQLEISNKKIVCILSGGNNDITRYPEIIEKYLRYKYLKHYLIIEFAQKPGELKKFVLNILGDNDDIVRFEYLKKTNKEIGKALIGIYSSNIDNIYNNLEIYNFKYIKINENDLLYDYLI